MLSSVLGSYALFSLTLRTNGIGVFIVPMEDSVVIPSQVQTHVVNNDTLAMNFNLTNQANYNVLGIECYVYFCNSTGAVIAVSNIYIDQLNAHETRHYYVQASAENLANFDAERISIDYLR